MYYNEFWTYVEGLEGSPNLALAFPHKLDPVRFTSFPEPPDE